MMKFPTLVLLLLTAVFANAADASDESGAFSSAAPSFALVLMLVLAAVVKAEDASDESSASIITPLIAVVASAFGAMFMMN